MAVKPHRVYFMEAALHDLADLSAELGAPYTMLGVEDWRDVMLHLKAHEVVGVTSKGYMVETTEDNQPGFRLFQLARDYLQQNNNGGLLPASEIELSGRVRAFLEEVETNYEWVDTTPADREQVSWDLRARLVA